MKKFYLFVILLVCGLGYAQGQTAELGSYEVIFNGSVYNDEHHNCGTAFVTLEFSTPADNYKALDITYSDNRKTDYYTNVRTTFKANKVLQSLYFSASRYDKHSCNGNRPYNMGRVTRRDRFLCYNDDFEFKEYRNVGSDGDGLGTSSFNIKIRPVLVIVDPASKNDLPTDTKVTVSSNTGFDSSEYNWQYSFDYTNPYGWVNMPQFATKSSFTASAKDILGDAAGEYHGKKIYIRQLACTSVSNTVTYIVRQSAPLIESYQEQEMRCFGSNDAKVNVKFNRPLFNTEKLIFSIKRFDEILNVWTDVICSGQADKNSFNGSNFIAPCNFEKGKYSLTFAGFINDATTSSIYIDSSPYIFNIGTPDPVDFSIKKKNDINCHGGLDGAITVTATGGAKNGIFQYSTDHGVNWKDFENGATTSIEGLTLGYHYVKVRKIKDASDILGCIALTPENKEKELSEEITQPDGPLIVEGKVSKSNPTFHKAENGTITASISGGTPIKGNSYAFIWTNSKNDKIDASKSSTQFANNVFTISLKNVPADTYKLSVTDERNCLIDQQIDPNLEVTLIDPDPIKVDITVEQKISCNSESLNPIGGESKSADGILKATVSGGVPFEGGNNGGQPYKIFWSKYNEDTKEWDELSEYKKLLAENLSEGSYSLNVEDANGIVQGTYDTEKLLEAKAAIQKISEPDKIQLSYTWGDVSCHKGNNGWATVTAIGGTGVYTYKWYNTGEGTVDENKISNLIKGTYTIEVTDENGCFSTLDIDIDEPDFAVSINYETLKPPTFSGGSNGKIIAEIKGGTEFDPASNEGRLYNYEWKNSTGKVQNPTAEVINGVYTITLNNVPADFYYLTVTDKNYNEAKGQTVNCTVAESEVQLTEPDPIKVVFKIVQTISCNAKNEFGDNTDTTPKDDQRDESQDGILKAHVTGGIPLPSDENNGLPYYFYWKKQKDDGSWINLTNIKGETASNLSYGTYALNVKDRNGIVLGTYVNNELAEAIDVTQFMDQPPVLSVKIEKGDVFCNGGNDGWATATAEGGSGKYTYEWSNEVKSDKNTVLKTGNYWVIAKDEKGCTAYAEVFIDQPKAPLAIKYTEVVNPSFYKATNGKIVVEVNGGTIAADNTYWFEWKNSKGVVQTSFTTSFENSIYRISLTGLPEETYTLTVRDANYNAATNKTSCTVANSVIELDDPDPIEVTFEVIRTISCNVSNEFGNEIDANPLDNQRDESQDGILKANVTGGIQLNKEKNNGLPYYYTWKKKQANGSWAIWNNTGDTAEYLSEGTYALNIEDANGIKLGTYVNNVLVKEIDAEKYIPQPDQLKLTFTKFDVGCTTGDDGWAEAHVTGGTPPYTYEWTNGETTSKIENITTNNYFVIATDAKGCVVQGSIFVGDPNGILSTETVKNPICYKGNDGSIELNVTGGNLPYTYLWNTGAVTKDLNNLTAGNYEVTITCPECCVYKKRFVLKDPEPVIVNVGPDRTLCIDQSLDLDASIKDPPAKYSWTSTNGFTSNEAKINVSKAGTYHVKVTSSLGCIGEDEIVIKTSQMAISAEFLLSSQAYLDEEVILVNTSSPFGESTDWVVPNGVKVVEQKEKYITLKFDAIGVYSIGLKQTQGECYAVYTKNIMVEKRGTLPNTETASQFIIDFIVTPNPNNGNFKAIVNLENNSAINLRLFSSSGQNTMIQKQESGKKKYEVDFNTSLQSGVYIVVLETGQQTLVKKIIIN
ncbi:T9SS type A sorting domain-containing protein [Flavobacterium tyrosinilyticum]|uniref:T9SS type A sorting domain-containing protein n=1 Tax=Flavobacterium tyrosinilyticum TaxID=1658740 RepID=UPI00202FB09C|nr:T9SS type A sorting domain-containing protein [Flavobacterium tyrosinilyticum]MCM0667759.1 T9SS type A sorting domain-containing protein [Flavobacterium tyrosinilyticum]